ncbi:unnamed protein product [Musa banksii]
MGKNINSTNSLVSFSFSRIQRCIDLAFLDTVQQNMVKDTDKFLSICIMHTGWKNFTCYTCLSFVIQLGVIVFMGICYLHEASMH